MGVADQEEHAFVERLGRNRLLEIIDALDRPAVDLGDDHAGRKNVARVAHHSNFPDDAHVGVFAIRQGRRAFDVHDQRCRAGRASHHRILHAEVDLRAGHRLRQLVDRDVDAWGQGKVACGHMVITYENIRLPAVMYPSCPAISNLWVIERLSSGSLRRNSRGSFASAVAVFFASFSLSL